MARTRQRRRRLQIGRRLDRQHRRLHLVERPRQTGREAVRQQRKCHVAGAAIPARDVRVAVTRLAPVGPVVAQPASAGRMVRAGRKACLTPRLRANIGLVGQGHVPAYLQPATARRYARAGHLSHRDNSSAVIDPPDASANGEWLPQNRCREEKPQRPLSDYPDFSAVRPRFNLKRNGPIGTVFSAKQQTSASFPARAILTVAVIWILWMSRPAARSLDDIEAVICCHVASSLKRG